MKEMFYFIDNGIPTEDYEFFKEKLLLLENGLSVIEIIDQFYYKIGEDNSLRINKSFFLEAFTFIDFCKNTYDIGHKDIIWVFRQNFLLFNRDFYIFDENGFLKIDMKNAYFVNMMRYPWYNHIWRIAEKLGVNFLGINHIWDWPYLNDKMHFISNLYKGNLNKYVGDLIVPFITYESEETYKLLYNFIVDKFPTKQIVLKKAFGEMGTGVKAVDLNKIDQSIFMGILKNKFVNVYSMFDAFYIVPFYEILYENRIYYTYDKIKNNLKIFAVKQKNTNFEGVFELESFELYKGIQVSWSYVNKDIVINNTKMIAYLKKLVKLLGLEAGVIEIGILGDGDYRFFEVNQYGGTLMFKEDQKDMYDFYFDIYQSKFNSLK